MIQPRLTNREMRTLVAMLDNEPPYREGALAYWGRPIISGDLAFHQYPDGRRVPLRPTFVRTAHDNG